MEGITRTATDKYKSTFCPPFLDDYVIIIIIIIIIT